MSDFMDVTGDWNGMTVVDRAKSSVPAGVVTIADQPSTGRTPLLSRGNEGEQPGLIMVALQGLDEIVAAHSTWLKSWHIRVLAGLSAGGKVETAERPDLQQWVRVFNHQTLVGHPASNDAIDRLRTMLEQADGIAATVQRTGSMPPEAYSRFMTTVLDFTSSVRDLQNDAWKRLANVDPLTGLGNRQAMWRRLSVESERHSRNRQPCCVAMIDLDDFKPINDGHGHAAGDVVLASVASMLSTSIRPYDSVFRFGGDEFLICLPNSDTRSAWAIVERLRLKIANQRIALRPGVDVRTTLSIGIAPLSSAEGVEASLDHADQALYAAKRNGRNCVYVWSKQNR